jgi:hypothetical protein
MKTKRNGQEFTSKKIFNAAVSEIVNYFEGRADELALNEFEAWHIASGIVLRCRFSIEGAP